MCGFERLEIQRSPTEVFRPFDFDQDTEALLLRIAVLFRLNEASPDFVVNASGFIEGRRAVETGDTALRQDPALSQLWFAEKDGDLRSIFKRGIGGSPASLPERKVPIVKDHSAATRSHLSKPIRQDCGNETNVHRKSRIDVLV